MDEKSVTFAMYQMPEEAALAQAYLSENGVESHLLGDVIGTALNYFGNATGGVRLQGLEVDATRANDLLKELNVSNNHPVVGEWICSNCSETVDANFEVCWSCNAERTEETLITSPSNIEATDDEAIEKIEIPEEPTTELMNRAWKASILGIAFFPIILYAMSLLLKLSYRQDPEINRAKFYSAWLIVVAMSAFYYFLLSPLFS